VGTGQRCCNIIVGGTYSLHQALNGLQKICHNSFQQKIHPYNYHSQPNLHKNCVVNRLKRTDKTVESANLLSKANSLILLEGTAREKI